VITGYHAAVSPERLGLGVVAFLSLAIPYEFRPVGTFERAVAHLEEVLECYRITGEDAYLIKVATPDLDALREIIDRLGEFGRVKSTLVLSAPKGFTPLTPREATRITRSGAD
jgi:Lrp/AsnC family transcriptional regulator, leucine-responsive regulatory protein